jgi:hypothetical protein
MTPSGKPWPRHRPRVDLDPPTIHGSLEHLLALLERSGADPAHFLALALTQNQLLHLCRITQAPRAKTKHATARHLLNHLAIIGGRFRLHLIPPN